MSEQWHTARLLARAPEPADRGEYLSLFLDTEIDRWLRPPPLAPFEDSDVLAMLAADRRHWSEHGFGPWALVGRDSGALLGRGGLRLTELDGEPAVELPWTIRSGFWSRGLATEAVAAAIEWARALELEETIALIRPENDASRRVAEKAGLRLDGITEHAGLDHLLYRLPLLSAAPG